MEVKLPDLLGKYDRQTDRPTDERKKSGIREISHPIYFLIVHGVPEILC